MEGLIIKILSNLCFVKVDKEVIVCNIRGKFRNMQLLPLVGDRVIIDKDKHVIEKILDRRNKLVRPPVSNITQGIIITSLVEPDFSTNLIDKILTELEFNNIKPIIILTKSDLLKNKDLYNKEINYYKSLYPVYYNYEIDEIKKIFKEEISVFIGQTGAGKSTLLNKLEPNLNLATGEISQALGRGKHTTRHVEIFSLFDGMILDTPGFSALEFTNMTKTEVRDSFKDFKKYPCIYKDCMHTNEPECKIKENVLNGNILESRYTNYLSFIENALSNRDKYKRKD